MADVMALAKDQPEQAEAIDGRLRSLHQHLFSEPNPIPVKWSLYRMGMIEDAIRLPLLSLSKTHQHALEDALIENNLIH